MSVIRLQKITYESGLYSRRKADLRIKKGKVTLNDRKAVIVEKKDPISDQILINGKYLPKKQNHKVFLLNKPLGAISSCKDSQGRKTILSLLPSNLRFGIHPVGRLDSNSRGAILLTNNGDVTLSLTPPSYSHSKTCFVWISGQPNQSILDKWREGILLDEKMTIPATINVMKVTNHNTLLKVILKEGRNLHIREIASLIGNQVQDLRRIAISNIKLNGFHFSNKNI